jgi:hypothetical protein
MQQKESGSKNPNGFSEKACKSVSVNLLMDITSLTFPSILNTSSPIISAVPLAVYQNLYRLDKLSS